MKNKGFVITLTVIITALCIYYLSFSLIANKVQREAVASATDAAGVVDLDKKQRYLDSVWNVPVFNLFGIEYTYKEVKENELGLGLDLQGGMHATLEVSPSAIVKGLSGNAQDSVLLRAIATAEERLKNSQSRFSDLFYEAFKEQNPNLRLTAVFANAKTRELISLNDTDEEVMTVIQDQIESAVSRSYTIIKNRIDQYGTSNATVQRIPGTGRIQVEVPGADNQERIRNLLQGVARLEFWDVIEPTSIATSIQAINDYLVRQQQSRASELAVAADTTQESQPEPVAADTTTTDDGLSDLERELAASRDSAISGLDSLEKLSVSPLLSLSTPAGYFRYALSDTAQINRIFKMPQVKNLLPRNVGVYWANKVDTDLGTEALQLYFINLGRTGQPRLTGEVISDARQDLDEYARPCITMNMNAAGTREWARMTAEAVNKSPRGRVAIVLDNLVYSAATVQSEIANGSTQITGNFTIDEAKDLANILKAGSLPAPTKIVEEAVVGPTLGEVARNQGLTSMAFGLALVIVFMVAYYSKSGFVANFALFINVFFILGILAQPTIAAALTLPGIAGIVLTMGMAVDANVLIFERIKEERAAGRKLKDAIRVGYERAFWTIFDSNLTTLLTGVFLFFFGQGPIKGFATTLIIGILTSFFTAIYITRVFVEWMTRRGEESKISFETPLSNLVKKHRKFEFIKHGRMAYLISGGIIALGFALLLVKGLNLGVDFKGGRSYVVSFNKPVVATEMDISLSQAFGNASTEVKNYGGNNRVKITTSYLIEDDSDEGDNTVRTTLINAIQDYSGLTYSSNETQVDDSHFAISSSSKVGATVADDIKDSAWEASLFSLIAIFVYILIRFRKWQYSAAAVIATVHDTLFVFAAFAIANFFGIGFEVDQVFVAAVLTIIGYSINDTVIIFDRIREYMGMGTSHDVKKIFNDAINDTLSRTIITSGTTLFVVLVLFIAGGEVLRGFSFALLVGIVVGTFSSMFVASSAVLDMDKQKQSGKSKTPAAA